MKTDIARLMFLIMLLFAAAAVEDMMPSFAGTGFPVLLAATALLPKRFDIMTAFAFAAAAGSFEESLSHLPAFSSVIYFLAIVPILRHRAVPRIAVLLAYPVFRLWLLCWRCSPPGETWMTYLATLPAGMAAIAMISLALLTAGGEASSNV